MSQCDRHEDCFSRVWARLEKEIQDGAVRDQAFKDHEFRQESKIEDCQTVSNTCLEMTKKAREEVAAVKVMALDAVSSTAAASKIAESLNDKWDGLWWKIILSCVMGSAGSAALIMAVLKLFKLGGG